ncbi:hypothetical protein V1517DRAFT_121600 [Lipomyces orientalis]|uniref:Uncharacterized protein n=1 Tax=Lipomyces orientalis TaxID=1233043 RepID=A0ACC3TP40_9ASCO
MPSFRFTGWHAARIVGACVVLLILFAAPTPKSTRSALDQANYTPSGFKYVPPWQKDAESVTDNSKFVVSESSASNPAPPPAPLSSPPPPPSPPSFASDAPPAPPPPPPPPLPASDEQTPEAEPVLDSASTVEEPPAEQEATDAAIEEPPVEEDAVLPTTDKRSSINIFLMNIPRYHFEVVLPLLHAFSSLPSVNVTLIASPSGYNRFGVGPLLEREAKPYGLQLVDQKYISADLGTPDLLFLTSCPEDIVKANKTITKWLKAGTRVQCIAHEPSKWDARPSGNSQYAEQIKYMVPWIEKGQWEIVVLAPHVQKFVRENFPSYFGTSENVVYRAPIIHPVFKANKEDIEVDFVEPFAAIPGKYEPWRRNYDRIFKQYEQARPQAKLHLVGSGDDLSVPESIKSRIVYVRDLTFPEYFEHLGKSVALIPAFGSEAYILHQASSTVATALIVGTPLLANSTIAQAYSQIPEEAMWLQNPGESEMDAFGRISFVPVHMWAEKKAKVAEVRDKMIVENVEFYESVAQEISDSKSKKSNKMDDGNGF